jgi:hypothetical protein
VNVEFITREDLEQFKKELFEELRGGGQQAFAGKSKVAEKLPG